ncbi:hypothetical protein NHX12_024116, partial [Muraenolepis orangiensis]
MTDAPGFGSPGTLDYFLRSLAVLNRLIIRGRRGGPMVNLHAQDNSWFTADAEKLPIMVLMPMNESALMSGISQGIEPAVQLAIQHIRDSQKYSFTLITKIYDTEASVCREMSPRFSALGED